MEWLDFSLLLASDFELPFGLLFCQWLYPSEDGKQNFQFHNGIALNLLVNELFLGFCEAKRLCKLLC